MIFEVRPRHIGVMNKQTNGADANNAALAAALAGDESLFTTLAERHRRELQVHCYRMLGSFDDAEDLVQETLLKAWRRRETYQGRSSLRAWLYGIATNACLDFLEQNPHRVLAARAGSDNDNGAQPPSPGPPPPEVSWLQPYPDRLVDEPAAPASAQPEAAVTAKETIRLAFLVAIQFLPPKQRAALILCDVLDWSAQETADLLALSVASTNSALQRARATLQRYRPRLQSDADAERKIDGDSNEQHRVLLERYVAATERGDVPALAALLQHDVRFSMPPEPGIYVGRDNVVGGWVKGGFGSAWFGDFRCLLTRANGMPAVACYVRKPGAASFRPLALDVLVIREGLVQEITTFPVASMVRAFDLPQEL
jgi:RNA polymerase sigma-70 factor, ECF subfamily